ncbi:MAG: nitroreductase family protein [Acidimicrobiales bacterium]|jgi:nitroreductase|nr:nitroreductase family protein [Acidimicrobiia bacterium]HIL48077.1 nitroreductase family protein [Acidimicrobiia bacterium]
MDLQEAMRTTFACREFTDDPVPDEVLHRILDVARFAPSGGNRQGGHVVVVRDREVRQRLGELCGPTMRLYAAQVAAGESPFNTVVPSAVDVATALDTPTEPFALFEHLGDVPVALVVSVDLAAVASMDKDLDRVGLATGASIYPLVWNILLAARAEGLGGVVTTAVVPAEAEVQHLLDLPETHAVAALIPLGVPVRQLTRLKRQPVEDFTTVDSFDGPPLAGPAVNEA